MRRCRMLLSVSYTCNFRSLFQFHGVVNFGLLPGIQSLPLRVSLQLSIGGADSGNFAMLCVVTPPPPPPPPTPFTRFSASSFLPSAHPCSAAPFSLSSVRSVDWVTQHKHKCLPSLGSMPFYAGRLSARALAPSDKSVPWSGEETIGPLAVIFGRREHRTLR